MTDFTVPGPPQGKARARTFYNPRIGRSVSYTPDKTVLYENLIKSRYIEAADGIYDSQDPIRIRIYAYFEPTKSVGKKKRQQMLSGDISPTKKPDADNIAKVVCDALNGLAYHDDSQICEIYVKKLYGEVSRLEISIDKYDQMTEGGQNAQAAEKRP